MNSFEPFTKLLYVWVSKRKWFSLRNSTDVFFYEDLNKSTKMPQEIWSGSKIPFFMVKKHAAQFV